MSKIKICYDSGCGNFCPQYSNNCDALTEAIEPDECFARISKKRDREIYHEIMENMRAVNDNSRDIRRAIKSEYERQKIKESYRE